MIGQVSKKITDRWIDKGIIKAEDSDIYQFGLEQLGMNLLNVGTALLAGLFLHEILPCVVFLAAFIMLRPYAGGYHAATRIGCYFLTTTAVITSLLVVRFVNLNNMVMLVMFCLMSSVLLVCSPMDTENRRLDKEEIAYNKKRAFGVWMLETIIGLVLFWLGYRPILTALIMAVFWVAFSQILLVIMEKWRNSSKKQGSSSKRGENSVVMNEE